MTGIVGARVIIGAAADSDLLAVGTVVAILERDRDNSPEWVAVHWDADEAGVDRREALDELICIGSDRDAAAVDQLPGKLSDDARALADRIESRITDPAFCGGKYDPLHMGYAEACRHAAELVRMLAAEIEEAGQ